MSRAAGGGMAAVVGMTVEQIRAVLAAAGFTAIDVANLNSPKQSVISGMKDDVLAVRPAFEAAGAKMFVPLDVSGAFHSRYMQPAQVEFEHFVRDLTFAPPAIPVIANVTARPYEANTIVANITRQITHPVRWVESMQYALQQPEPEFEEIGPGAVLTSLLRQIRAGSR
jgi:trans-AT polyketide synthase/acyltransferase/oxidoreductase domain-containing protein